METVDSRLQKALETLSGARVLLLFLFHAFVFWISYVAAYLIRFEFAIPDTYQPGFEASLPVVVGVQLLVGVFFGFYKGWWRYVGITDVVKLVIGLTTAQAILIALWFVGANFGITTRFELVSRGALLIDWAFALLTLFGVRIGIRLFRDRTRLDDTAHGHKRVLIVGAGDAGESLAREIQHRPRNETHAHWRLENTMAKTPERAMDLMLAVWKPAIARVDEEVADMQTIADEEGADITIAPWDYRYYAEKVRKAKYDLDQNEVKEYMQLDKMREAMMWVAGQLFDFDFVPVTNVPVYHPDVRVFEVKNRTTGAHIGLWYFDPYARQGKRSAAWMNAYRDQERFDGEITTIVSNNSNFVKGNPGESVLISWTDAETMFHEFSHALHGLSSNVTYPRLSGTNVVRDYVEFPSQLVEHWLDTPEVLETFALHYETGEPIPQALVDKIGNASTFN